MSGIAFSGEIAVRDAQRARLAQQTAEFLAKGGQIQKLAVRKDAVDKPKFMIVPGRRGAR